MAHFLHRLYGVDAPDYIQTVKQDIARAGAKGDDVPQLAIDREVWRSLTARCIVGAE